MEILKRSWERAWQYLGVTSIDIAAYPSLIMQYQEQHRSYHTLDHLVHCLSYLEPIYVLGGYSNEMLAEVEMALWFHDAIYNIGAKDNEHQSAKWAFQILLDHGVNTGPAMRIFDLIMATQHKALPETEAQKLLIDIDLAILGAHPDGFRRFNEQIRREYGIFTDEQYYPVRMQVLQSFLARPKIFLTSSLAALEEPARINLQGEIDRIKQWTSNT